MRIIDWSSDVCSSDLKYRNTKPKVVILKKLLIRLRSLEIPCSSDGWGRSGSLGQWVALTLVEILLCRFRGRARCVRGKQTWMLSTIRSTTESLVLNMTAHRATRRTGPLRVDRKSVV